MENKEDSIKQICDVLKNQRIEINELKETLKLLIENDAKEKQPTIPYPMRSTEIDKLCSAMADVHKEIGEAAATKMHGQFKDLYATLADYLHAGRGILGKHGIYVLQEDMIVEDQKYLFTTITHKSGQYSMSYAELKPTRSDIQGMQSYNTSLRKMTYGSVVGISYAKDDDDGTNSMSKEELVAVEKEASRKRSK